MKIWKVILAVAVIFGAGVGTGIMLAPARVAAPIAPVQEQPSVALPGPQVSRQGRIQFVQKIDRDLNLTPEQRDRIEGIMRDSHEHMAKVWEPIAPQAREETRRVREQIHAVLTPDQRRKFDQMTRRRPRDFEDRKPMQRPHRAGPSNVLASPGPQ